MRRTPKLSLAALILSAAPAVAPAGPTPLPVAAPARTGPVSYAKDLADALGAKCVGCHNEALAKNALNMEEVSGMLKGGKSGPAVVPGKADESLLFKMAAHRVEPVMPPKDKKGAEALSAEELGLLKLWIDAGAKDDSAAEGAAKTPITLGELPPGVQPINAVDLTADGTRVACGRANVVQVYDVDSGLEIVSLGGHKDLIQSVRFSPDGRRLAAGGYQIVTLWNLPTGGLQATFNGHGDQVRAVALLPDGAVASAGFDKTVRVWDRAGKQVKQFNTPAPVLALAVSPDGRRLAVGGADHVVRVLDAADGKEFVALSGHGGAVQDLAFLPGGGKLASVAADGTGRVWTLPAKAGEKPAEPSAFAGDGGPLRAVALLPGGAGFAAAGDAGDVRFWGLDLKPLPGKVHAEGGPILALAVGPAGDLVLTGSADGTARLFDRAGGTPRATLGGHHGPVNSVAFGPGGRHLATAGGDGGVKVWEAATGRGVTAFGHTAPNNGPIQPIQKVAFAGEGALVTASADRTLKSWTFQGGWSESPPLGPHAFRVLALDFHPDGTLLAAGGGEPSRSGEIRVWEVGKGLPVRTLSGLHSDTVFGLRFSPDGTKLASAGADKFLKVTRVSDGKELRSFEGHSHHVLAVDWKSDGKQIVTGGADNVIKLWDVESGEQVRTFQPAGKQVTAVRWLAGKPEVLGASGDKTVRIWNPDNGGTARNFNGPGDYVFAAAASADGSRVAAGGADSVLFVWNGQNAQVIRKFDPPAPAKAKAVAAK